MNAPTPWLVETVFLYSSSLSIFNRALAAAPLLAVIYLLFIFLYAIGCFKLRPPDPIMFHSPLSIFNLFIFCTLQLSRFANGQTATPTTTSFRPIFTVPSSADVGMFTFPANPSCIQTTPQLAIERSLHEGICLKEGVLTPDLDRCDLDT